MKIIEYILKKLFRTLRNISISTHGVFLILRFGEYNENFAGVSLNWKKKITFIFPQGFLTRYKLQKGEKKSTKQ